MTTWGALVSAEDLAAALNRADEGADRRDGPIVVDARFVLADPGAGEAAYRHSHLPGAYYAHLDRDLSDHRKSVGGRHPWPDAETFSASLGRWGVTPQRQVVVYDDADGALAASRLWFLLRALGHARVAVLDGGWRRWNELGLPVSDVAPSPHAADPHEPGPYPTGFDARRLLDARDVSAHVAHGGLLLDARAAERFRGEVEPLDKVAGHVPGAVNRPYALNLEDGRFKSADRLAREFAELFAGRESAQVAVMCGSGVTACHHLLAMAHAGYDSAALFAGSWSGWIEDAERPVATGSQ